MELCFAAKGVGQYWAFMGFAAARDCSPPDRSQSVVGSNLFKGGTGSVVLNLILSVSKKMREAGPDYREDRTNLLSLNRIQIIHRVLLTIVVAAPLLSPQRLAKSAT